MRSNKGYIKDDINFRVLFENANMVLGHVFESSYCCNKLTKETFAIFEFNSDPTCGLIGKNNDWCLIGGDVLVLWTWIDNPVCIVEGLKHIFDIKEIDAYTIQILTDPWANESAIWELKIDLEKLSQPIPVAKVRDFKEYADKPYTDQIEW